MVQCASHEAGRENEKASFRLFRYNMRCQPTKERDAMTDNILNLKTAVEGARGFYISRRGAETRRFMGRKPPANGSVQLEFVFPDEAWAD
jgi:hypothetical protein